MSSATLESEKRHKRQGKDHDGLAGAAWLDPSVFFTDAGITILLVLLAIAGVLVVVYAVVFAFTDLLSFGEVHRSRKYYKKVEAFDLDEREGSGLGRKLNQTNIYFSLVLFVFAIEEGVRFVLHTGPATFEIWVFRIICFGLFTIIIAIFLCGFTDGFLSSHRSHSKRHPNRSRNTREILTNGFMPSRSQSRSRNSKNDCASR